MYVRFYAKTSSEDGPKASWFDFNVDLNFGRNDGPLDAFRQAVRDYCNQHHVTIEFDQIDLEVPDDHWSKYGLYPVHLPEPMVYELDDEVFAPDEPDEMIVEEP